MGKNKRLSANNKITIPTSLNMLVELFDNYPVLGELILKIDIIDDLLTKFDAEINLNMESQIENEFWVGYEEDVEKTNNQEIDLIEILGQIDDLSTLIDWFSKDYLGIGKLIDLPSLLGHTLTAIDILKLVNLANDYSGEVDPVKSGRQFRDLFEGTILNIVSLGNSEIGTLLGVLTGPLFDLVDGLMGARYISFENAEKQSKNITTSTQEYIFETEKYKIATAMGKEYLSLRNEIINGTFSESEREDAFIQLQEWAEIFKILYPEHKGVIDSELIAVFAGEQKLEDSFMDTLKIDQDSAAQNLARNISPESIKIIKDEIALLEKDIVLYENMPALYQEWGEVMHEWFGDYDLSNIPVIDSFDEGKRFVEEVKDIFDKYGYTGMDDANASDIIFEYLTFDEELDKYEKARTSSYWNKAYFEASLDLGYESRVRMIQDEIAEELGLDHLNIRSIYENWDVIESANEEISKQGTVLNGTLNQLEVLYPDLDWDKPVIQVKNMTEAAKMAHDRLEECNKDFELLNGKEIEISVVSKYFEEINSASASIAAINRNTTTSGISTGNTSATSTSSVSSNTSSTNGSSASIVKSSMANTILNTSKNLALTTASMLLPGGPLIAGMIKKKANGGILDAPIISLVAEDGPESIIPLSAKRRERGIQFWEQTGRLLGISSTHNAYENYKDDIIDSEYDNRVSLSDYYVANTDHEPKSPNINVNVNMTPEFSIQTSGDDEDRIVKTLRRHIRDMVDDVGDELAVKLNGVFSNMPLVES